MIKKIKGDSIIFILLFLVSIPSFFVLLKPGFYEPHDLHHIADIYQMVRAIESGQIPPRLGPDFSFGYGYPLFNYYYLLPFYLGALLFFIFGSLTLSFKWVMIAGVLLSVSGMYLFLKEYTHKVSAFIGSFLFVYTPYRAIQIYVRGAVGEVLTIALLPWVAWLYLKLIKRPTLKLVALSSLITTFFFLSHNYLSFLSLPVIMLMILPAFWESKRKSTIIPSLLTTILLSLGISAYWWLPALLEQKLVLAATPFQLADHFPFIKQLIIPSWGYGASLWGPDDGLSFQVGVVNLMAIVMLVVMLLFSRKRFKKNLYQLSIITIGGFILSFMFMNIRTLPFWKLIPFYNFIQFPWRLLFYSTLFTSLAGALVIEVAAGKMKRLLAFALIIFSFVLTINYFRPEKIVDKSDDAYLARFFANRSIAGKTGAVSEQYLGYSEDYLLLPRWVEKRPESLPERKIEIVDGEIIEEKEITAVYWKAKVKTDNSSKLVFNSYYFPGWTANVNNFPSAINIKQPHGNMEIDVPAGISEVEFIFKETGWKKNVDLFSFMLLLVAIYFVISNREKISLSRR